jgi:hypothetical protein
MYSKTIVFIIFMALVGQTDASCRSQTQVHKFEKQQGYPKGRPGYVVDHVCALACGGVDDPSNMQYQTYAEGKAKDKWERTEKGCAALCTASNSTKTRQVFNCK